MNTSKRTLKRSPVRRTSPAGGGAGIRFKGAAPKQRKSSPLSLDLRSILAPVDFSRPSWDSLRFAASLARQLGARLTILSVIEPVVYPDFAYFPLSVEDEEMASAVQEKLKTLCREQRLRPGLVDRIVIRIGNPFQEICAAASELGADLIVMGTHGYTGLKHAWLGSTAERVLRHAPCAVLVARQSQGTPAPA